MADNVAITAGSGTNIATDDTGTEHVQIVKLAQSADGSKTHITADADGMYVQLSARTLAQGSIAPGTGTGSTEQLASGWVSAIFKNTGSVTVYLDHATGATSSDYPLEVGETISFGPSDGGLFMVTASGTGSVHYFTET